jgi:hypothetical protein
MENAAVRLHERLMGEENAYGFFFYAGHGVQSGGENFLIPIDAKIPTENNLRTRALSVQTLLDDLNDAQNGLNVIVLDACRDNPFGWSRGAGRGLTIVTRQPADSIIVYATSAGQRASDGEGRNGLFTSHLINNLATPGLEVNEVFRRTGQDVARVSNNSQVPAIYSQFFGTAYLGEAPEGQGGVQISKPVIIYREKQKESAPARFWTVGASAGSSFAVPWLIGTVHGTIAPFKYSFLELGLDVGMVSGMADVGYYSLYPYVHYAFFMPFAKKGGWYVGAGAGYMRANFDFEGNEVPTGYFAADVVAGVNLWNMLDISYTLRTNFKRAGSKVSVGYVYRFK